MVPSRPQKSVFETENFRLADLPQQTEGNKGKQEEEKCEKPSENEKRPCYSKALSTPGRTPSKPSIIGQDSTSGATVGAPALSAAEQQQQIESLDLLRNLIWAWPSLTIDQILRIKEISGL